MKIPNKTFNPNDPNPIGDYLDQIARYIDDSILLLFCDYIDNPNPTKKNHIIELLNSFSDIPAAIVTNDQEFLELIKTIIAVLGGCPSISGGHNGPDDLAKEEYPHIEYKR